MVPLPVRKTKSRADIMTEEMENKFRKHGIRNADGENKLNLYRTHECPENSWVILTLTQKIAGN